MNTVCRCKTCGVQPGMRTGLSGLAHLVNIVLVFLTGLLWAPIYVLFWACSYKTICVKCGNKAKKI